MADDRPSLPEALPLARQDRAHDLRAAVRLRRRVPRRRRCAERRRPRLDHRGDGRRPQPRDGAQPADRRGYRRAEPANGRTGAAAWGPAALAGRALRLASLAVFLVAVYQLAPIVHWLWPIPVAAFVVYPYLKRATWLSHFWLGAVDGLAPVGAWAAVTNELPLEAWLLGAAVAFWVAGFDVLYALFDLEIDRAQGLHSIPARFGVPGDASRSPGSATSRPSPSSSLAGLGLSTSAPSTGSASLAVAVLLALRALARLPTGLAPARHGLLHDERRDQRHVLRLRARGRGRVISRARPRPQLRDEARAPRSRPRRRRARLPARHGAERLGEDHAPRPLRGPARAHRAASSRSRSTGARSATSPTSRSSTGS